MATVASVAQQRPTIDLQTEVIIGSRRSRKWLTLDVPPDLPADSREQETREEDTRLLVAINPTGDFAALRHLHVERFRFEGDAYWLRFPSWMQPPAASELWRSQSTSGALYPSRTDLRQAFGIPGVLLLQILHAQPGRTCFTSRHQHLGTREIFDPLEDAGGAEYQCGARRWQRLTQRLEVPIATRHQLRRIEPGFSVVLIQMYGLTRIEHGPDGAWLDMSDHVYA